jgi:hypothetical protein
MMTDERAPAQSDRRLLVQAHFDRLDKGPVGQWIQDNRAAGMSWSRMSYALRDLTGLEVSYETLRRWHTDDEQTDSADA